MPKSRKPRRPRAPHRDHVHVWAKPHTGTLRCTSCPATHTVTARNPVPHHGYPFPVTDGTVWVTLR